MGVLKWILEMLIEAAKHSNEAIIFEEVSCYFGVRVVLHGVCYSFHGVFLVLDEIAEEIDTADTITSARHVFLHRALTDGRCSVIS